MFASQQLLGGSIMGSWLLELIPVSGMKFFFFLFLFLFLCLNIFMYTFIYFFFYFFSRFVDGNGHSDSEPGIGGALKAEADRIGKA